MCDGHDYCEDFDTIREWLRGKFIVLLYNQVRFDAEGYFENSTIEESHISYIPVSSQVRQIIPFKVS